MQENYPGEYIKMSTFESNSPSLIVPAEPVKLPLVEAPPPGTLEGPQQPQERTMDIYVKFTLGKITAEFPTVSSVISSPSQGLHLRMFMCGRIWPRRFPGTFPSPPCALTCCVWCWTMWPRRQLCSCMWTLSLSMSLVW